MNPKPMISIAIVNISNVCEKNTISIPTEIDNIVATKLWKVLLPNGPTNARVINRDIPKIKNNSSMFVPEIDLSFIKAG